MKALITAALTFAGTALGQTQPALTPATAPATSGVQQTLATEQAFMAERRQVTLKEALTITEKKNADLQAARTAIAAAAARTRQALAVALPELSVSASYVRTSVQQEFKAKDSAKAQAEGTIGLVNYMANTFGFPLTDAQLAPLKAQQQAAIDQVNDIVIVGTNSVYGNLLLTQVLFSPNFFLLPAAWEGGEAAKLGTLEAREQILLAVARVYLGLEGIGQLEQAAKEAEQVALKRERDAKAQASVGTSTEIAVLRAQSETAQARSLLSSLSGQRVALTALLEALVGEPVRPMDDTPTRFDITAAKDEESPWEHSYAIKAQVVGVKIQERISGVDKLTWLPTVVAQAKGSYNSNRGFAGTNFIFDGIVAAEWKLYDRGLRYAQMHDNEAKLTQQRAQLEAARAKAKANWIGAKTNLDAATVALQQAEAQAALATRAQKQVGAAYEAGLTTSLEVSDVDNKRFLAASSAAQSRAQLEIRKVELAAAEGRLASMLGLTEE
ncbi:MAG: TolC family protein [Archangiaceae bacterium]|nr:TolC family protein [Archangiaceae bacterium]